MVKYYFEGDRFIIENYHQAKTFSSFLPGVAGLKGIPIWAYYVNRGQAIATFGIRDKDGQILEFAPANMLYKTVELIGFRTFLKVNGKYTEAFSSLNEVNTRKMMINATSLALYEKNTELGYEITVTYYGLPNENFGALVRKVEIKNIATKPQTIEILDGLTTIIPYGFDHRSYKNMSNTFLSWMDVENLDKNLPFFKIRSSTKDVAEITEITRGHFYLSFINDHELIKPIVDADIIFNYDKAFLQPRNFLNNSLEELTQKPQYTTNKIPCGFTGVTKELAENETVRINTIIGNVEKIEYLEKQLPKITTNEYIDKKEKEIYDFIRTLTSDVETHSGKNLFDEYARQCFLDNMLRGGYPLIIPHRNGEIVYHLFSRKHGDPERDYNWFVIESEYYSQGNGNYRDICQNRRNDIYFNPRVGNHNIRLFMNLLQLDGYNPLLVHGVEYELKKHVDVEKLVHKCFLSHHEELIKLLKGKFTPGKIINFIENNHVKTSLSDEEIFYEIFSEVNEEVDATFERGYWVDHWIYNLDLIESYLGIFPDNKQEFLFSDNSYRFFYSPLFVLPRKDKYVLTKDGKIRQYGSLEQIDREYCINNGISLKKSNWLKAENGEVYLTNLYSKLVHLAMIKFATLDPLGIGIEMEANKPGWNDAMQGLPGLFGSSVTESLELLRLIEFLLSIDNESEAVKLPVEFIDFINNLSEVLETNLTGFTYWDKVTTLREDFRQKVKYGINGKDGKIEATYISKILHIMRQRLMEGLEKAKELGNGLYPTYLTYEATEYELIKNENDEPIITHYGLPAANVKAFKVHVVPYFLEAPAKALKVVKSKTENQKMHQLVKSTELYDQKLQMYRTSVSLENESYELGRARASFTPGWLERESNFMHMTYKYLLGLIKAGLYEEFFEEIKTNLTIFMDPEVYGRNTLENSSFIATSNNPDPQVHGQGFVPRLSGSTAEYLSMWVNMMFGESPFTIENGELITRFKPVLPGWLFDKDNKLQFKFLGKTMVTYINNKRLNTYDAECRITEITLLLNDKSIQLNQDYLPQEYALMLREGKINEIIVTFS